MRTSFFQRLSMLWVQSSLVARMFLDTAGAAHWQLFPGCSESERLKITLGKIPQTDMLDWRTSRAIRACGDSCLLSQAVKRQCWEIKKYPFSPSRGLLEHELWLWGMLFVVDALSSAKTAMFLYSPDKLSHLDIVFSLFSVLRYLVSSSPQRLLLSHLFCQFYEMAGIRLRRCNVCRITVCFVF